MSESKPIVTTVMFADICRSTFLFNHLGDTRAASLINETLQMTATLVKNNEGQVLRTKGDDVLCIFSDPVNALQASLEIHAKISQNQSAKFAEAAMSIGINSGPALLSEGDILGDTVNIAARLSSYAKAGQTLVSSQTMEMLGKLPTTLIRPFGEITLRGKSQPVSTFEVLDDSDRDEITQTGPSPLEFPQSSTLSLRYQSQQFKLDYLLTRHIMGRAEECNLVIDNPLVSRQHAEIRYHNNEFVLIDFSTNGTQLITNGQSNRLHHNQAALRGNGSIYLGRTVYHQKYEISFHASGGNRKFSRTYS